MANLQFLTNVTHDGVIFKGTQIVTDKQGIQKVIEGVIVDLEVDTRHLKDVAENLIDRGLAKFTNNPATHTSNFVSQSQEAIPINAATGTGLAPEADTIHAQDEQRKQEEATKAAADAAAKAAEAQKAQDQANVAAQNAGQQPQNGQPSAEQIAADAAAVA